MSYLVFDGYAIAYRAYHGYPEWKNNQGRDVQVTVGFFRQVLSVLSKEEFKFHKPVFVFDSPGGSFRNQMSADYKSNRNSATDSFYEQVDEIISLCKMIAPTYQVAGFEADDLAGSFVQKYVNSENPSILVTVDCDWLQLLSEYVRVYQLKTSGTHCLWTRELFFEKYEGLTPSQLVDVKAISGDGSDNIIGVRGVGWVKVNKLLREFRTVEDVYENILMVTNKGKLQESLIAEKDKVIMNKKLATIRRDVELAEPEFPGSDSTDRFLDYLLEELQAQNLANLMGIYFQLSREGSR